MRNFNIYYEKMAKNIEEKTNFLINAIDETKVDKIIDFGCANGKTTELLASIFENKKILGVEKENFVKILNKENTFDNIFYVSDVSNLDLTNSVIFLSSVLHEIFSEGGNVKFFDKFKSAKCIVIRDLYNIGDDTKWRKAFTKKEKDFLKGINKAFFTNKDYAQFLIKSLYEQNWEEEIKEDYFSVPFEDIEKHLLSYGFEKTFDFAYANDYIIKKIKKTHQEDYKTYGEFTHRKVVFVKKTPVEKYKKVKQIFNHLKNKRGGK